jgi:uncharacterized protein (PEP-CTERM system associated)
MVTAKGLLVLQRGKRPKLAQKRRRKSDEAVTLSFFTSNCWQPRRAEASKSRPLRYQTRVTLAVLLVLSASTVLAQSTGGARSLTVTPSFESGLTYTHRSSAVDGTNGDDLILQLRPGVQISSRSGRFQGSLNYSLGGIYRAGRTDGETLENNLSASLRGELVENWMFVDGLASITQQSLSAFGEQTVGSTSVSNANRVEVGNLSLTPYVAGRIGEFAGYKASLTAAATNTRRSLANDSTSTGGALSLSSLTSGAVLGWGLNATWQEVDFRQGRTTENGRVTASLNIVPDIELSFALRAGQESTNVGSLETRTYDNWGATARWTPSPRTSAVFDTDRRYFGNSHKLVLEHRMSRSSIRFSSVRDASNGADSRTVNVPVTLYQLISARLATQEPDPVLRNQLVLAEIAGIPGADPTQIIGAIPLSTGITLVRRDDVGFSYSGLRTTLNVLVFSSDSRVLDNPLQLPGEGRVRQWGYTGSVGYKLNPLDSVSLTGSQQRTLGNEVRLGNDLKSLSLGWTGQLGRRTSASLSARYTVFNSNTNPYKESSLSGSVSLRF